MERLIRNIGENMEERFDKKPESMHLDHLFFLSADISYQAKLQDVSLTHLLYFRLVLQQRPKPGCD
jgi:hypothetical protein